MYNTYIIRVHLSTSAPVVECSVVNNLGENLTLELHRVQMLFGHKLLGLATIPLHSIRHSNRVNLYRVQANEFVLD